MNASISITPSVCPQQNHLLAALPAVDFERLRPHLKLVHLSLGEVLCESGSHLRHVYFPTTALVSKLYTLADGAPTEVAMVGNDGFIGVPLLLGGNTTLTQAVVKCDGYAQQLPAQVLLEHLARGETLQRVLLRYAMTLLTQMAQIAVCYRHHLVDQQLARLLLMNLDRLPSNKLVMTQESISNMLGVRRESITDAVHKLQIAGVVATRRGQITVLNRAALEKISCECYAMIRKEYDRLLPTQLHPDSATGSLVFNRALRPVLQSRLEQGLVTKGRAHTNLQAVEC